MADIDTSSDARWVSQKRMAELLSVSRWTVQRARQAGRLGCIEVVDGLYRYDAHQVDELANSSTSRVVTSPTSSR